MSHIIDITKHYMSGSEILARMLDIWAKTPDEPITVITLRGDGAKLARRVRVKLSKIRRQLKDADVDLIQFGFLAETKVWLDVTKGTKEIVTMTRVVRESHKAKEVLGSIRLGKDKSNGFIDTQ